MKKILVLKGISAYNVLRAAADEVTRGFEKCGYEVEMVDALDEEGGAHFLDAVNRADEFEFYFSFQAIGWNEEVGRFPQMRKLQKIGWIVDDPVYHSGRLVFATGENAGLLIVRDSHAKQIKKQFPKFDKVAALYHGGFLGKQKIVYREKDIDVFFPGTYVPLKEADGGVKAIEGALGKAAYQIRDRIVGENLACFWLEEVRRYFEELSFEMSEAEFDEVERALAPLDGYQRAYMRNKVIGSLLENGIEVSVVGSGWEKYDGAGKENLHILSDTGVDIYEVVELMGRSKIVLNNTNILDGMHERIFTAMLANAVCLTNEYNLLKNFFTDGKEIVTFPLNRIEKLPDIVKNLLDHPEIAEKIAEAGYHSALQRHTWERRGQQIVKWFKDGLDFEYE